jgi:LPXTG-site transpeptidase (sortase) family protein
VLRQIWRHHVPTLLTGSFVLLLAGLLSNSIPTGASIAKAAVSRPVSSAIQFDRSLARVANMARMRIASPNSAPGIPMRLRIPSIGLDTSALPVGLTSTKALDIPADGKRVGWYEYGPRPGLSGNAVIDGHRSTVAGPAIFQNLHNLTVGDLLYVTDDHGATRAFRVMQMASYYLDKAPLMQIFGPSSAIHLNLITCNGTWLPQAQTFDQRLIVYTSLVQ